MSELLYRHCPYKNNTPIIDCDVCSLLEHCLLWIMSDKFGIYYQTVDPQDLFGFTMEQDLQTAHIGTGDLSAGEMFELRTADFVRDFFCRQLLLGFTDELISGMV